VPEPKPGETLEVENGILGRKATASGRPRGPAGLFRVVYGFENEKLVELINRTVHAAALSALG
jgi:hypothetical protein